MSTFPNKSRHLSQESNLSGERLHTGQSEIKKSNEVEKALHTLERDEKVLGCHKSQSLR